VEVTGQLINAALRKELDAIKSLCVPSTVTINVTSGDLGKIASAEFDRGVRDVTLVLTDPDGDYSIGETSGDVKDLKSTYLVVPRNCRLEIIAETYKHTAIRSKQGADAGRVEDLTRCPTTVHLKHLRIIEGVAGVGYAGRATYTSVVVEEHGHLKFRGVTLIEDHGPTGLIDRKPYHEGALQARGHGATISLWDARVEFTQESFVTSHSAGLTFTGVMHVRFVSKIEAGAVHTEQYPVTANRGQSLSGNEATVSRTDVVLDGPTWYPEGEDSGYGFTIRYLY